MSKTKIKPLTETLLSDIDEGQPFQHPFIANDYNISPMAELDVFTMKNLLKRFNKVNRPPQIGNINKIYDSIFSGNFAEITGNSIKFDKNGNLMDGQHRMFAHVKAELPLKSLVVYGLPPEAIINTDGNAPRSVALRALMGDGIAPSKETKSKKEAEFSVVRLWKWFLTDFKTNKQLSIADFNDFFIEHRDAIDKVVCSFENSDARRVGFRTAAAQYFEKDPAKAQLFFDGVTGDGSNLLANSPILVLRNYLRKTTSGGNPQQRKDYGASVKMIHSFHFDKGVNNISQQEEWQF